MEAGRPHGMVHGSTAAMEIRRIEAGILDNLTDFDHTMTPFAAGLGSFIHMDKDDFIGLDALRNADRRVRPLGLVCRTATPGPRGAVTQNGRSVGHVTAAAWSPTLDRGIGYVRFDAADEWIGREPAGAGRSRRHCRLRSCRPAVLRRGKAGPARIGQDHSLTARLPETRRRAGDLEGQLMGEAGRC